MVEAGFLINDSAERIGRETKSPSQFGQRPFSLSSTQTLQKVHSKEQIIASFESGGRSLSQYSQFGLSSNIRFYPKIITDNEKPENKA